MTATSTLPQAPTRPPGPSLTSGSRFQRWLASWLVSLKMARRDALRFKGRSALVVVMVGLPVALIVGGLTLASTSARSAREDLPARLGNAVALIDNISETKILNQSVEGWEMGGPSDGSPPPKALPIPGYAADAPAAEQNAALGAFLGGTIVPIGFGDIRWDATTERRPSAAVAYLDPTVDLGPKLSLLSGRWPTSNAEVAVTPAGIHQGMPKSGQITLRLPDGTAKAVTVVGEASLLDPNVGMPSLLTTEVWEGANFWQTQRLLQRSTPVSWDEVKKLNDYGLTVVSRAAIENPPVVADRTPEEQRQSNDTRIAAAMLGSTLFILTALLVGPAFAVSAGRQRRSLALAASNGAETRQLRRSVLASAVVLGVVAVVVGAAVGIAGALAAATYWRTTRPWTTAVGPNQVPWIAVAIVAICATLAALTAALIPALRLGRLDIIGVMKGQNVSPPHSRKLPIVGLILFAIGGIGTFLAVTKESAGAAMIGILGLFVGPLLLIPLMLVVAGRIAARFPAPFRMATRDAARQRHRSAPTVAAVMAGSALLATFAVTGESLDKFNERQYVPTNIAGEGTVWLGDPTMKQEFEQAAATYAPTWKLVPSYQISNYDPTSTTEPTDEAFASVIPPGCTLAQSLPDWSNNSDPFTNPCVKAGTSGGPERSGFIVIPADEVIRRLQLTGAAAEAVRNGAVGVADAAWAPGGKVTLGYGTRAYEANGPSGPAKVLTSQESKVDAYVIPAEAYARAAVDSYSGVVIPVETAKKLQLPTQINTYFLYDPRGPISTDAQKNVQEHLTSEGQMQIERGYQNEFKWIMLIVFGIAAFLLVTVTLISTALALAEQQSDMGTLAAVGATKGTRRRFAAAQAVTVALAGGLLGTLIGLVAGVALAYPQTSNGWDSVTGEPMTLSPTIGIPILPMLATLVGVPLIAGFIAAIAIRKAPTVTRRA